MSTIVDPTKKMQQQQNTNAQQAPSQQPQNVNGNGAFTQPNTHYTNPSSGMKSVNQTQNGYGVRDFMVANGMNNDKIGWNDATQTVTYDGKDFYKPDSVVDGVSYSNDQNKLYSQITNTLGANNIAVRDYFDNAGIEVDWDDENKQVTADGRTLDPAYITDDGKSYADKKTLQKMTRDIYDAKGNPLVVATDYAASKTGIGDLVQFRDGQISVGGIMLNPTYISDDGKAYIPTEQIDAAIAQYKEMTGLMSNKEVYDQWNEKYGKMADAQLDKILNREEWSYDMNKDPAYLAYRDQYQREGNRAFQDAIGSMASSTGGYMSSAAMTAGGQAQNYYMQQLNDRVPELQQNDYNRYLNEQNLRQQALNSIMDVGDSNYNKLYKSNRDTVNDLNYSNERVYKREQDAKEDERNRRNDDIDNQLKLANIDSMKVTDQKTLEEINGLRLQNKLTQGEITRNEMQDIINSALFNEGFNDDQADKLGIASIGTTADGKNIYPHPLTIQKVYSDYIIIPEYREKKNIDKEAQKEIDKANANNQIDVYNKTKN